MLTITVNNEGMTEEQALKDALEVNDQTGEPVMICNIIGDQIAYVENDTVKRCE